MPGPVDDYFKKVKKDNPSYSDEQAWATAWSIYCKHKNPGSEHCKKPTSEYFKGKSAMDEMVLRVAASAVDPEMAKRVASRAMRALALGKTFESDKWRIHRYRDFIDITHLENAGKRGKCDKWSLEMNFHGDSLQESLGLEILQAAKKNVSADQMEKLLQEQVAEFGSGYSLKLHHTQYKGVDVIPAGFGPMEISTMKIQLTVKMDGFSVRDMSEGREIEVEDWDGNKKKVMDYPNMPTCIPSSAGKKGLAAFYRWVKDNKSKVKNMSYSDVLDALKDLGIPYHTYCAMD